MSYITDENIVQAEPGLAFVEGRQLATNEIVVAEGTDFEKTITLRVPRGRAYRVLHRKLLSCFGELEAVSHSIAGDQTQIKPIIDAIEKLFGMDEFEDKIVPFALGIESKADKEWLDMLLPMEKFMAFMSAAGYIVSGGSGSNQEFIAAQKK